MAQDDFGSGYRGMGFEEELSTRVDNAQPSAVLSTSTGLDAFNDPQFLAELAEYYGKKGDIQDPEDMQALFDEFYSDQTWDSMNSIAAAHDIYETGQMDDRQVLLKGRIGQVYKSLPDAFSEGGRGFSGFAQNAFAALADPINVVGFGSGAVAAKVGARSVANLTQKQMLKRAAATGAITEGIVGTGIGAVQDSLQQGRDLATGIQDEFSTGRAVVAAGKEGFLSAGLGGLFGLAGGAAAIQARAGAGASTTDKVASAVLAPARAAGRGLDQIYGVFGSQFTLQAENARLARMGFSDADIQTLVDDGDARANIAMIFKNNLSRDDYFGRVEEGNVEGLEIPDAEEIASVGEEVQEDPRFPGLQQELAESEADLATRQVELQQDLNEARRTGDKENEAQILKELGTVASMEGLATRIANYQNEIAADLASPNAATVEKAQKRIRDLRSLIADYKNFSRDGDEVSAQAVKESEAILQAGSRQPEGEAPTPTATQAVDAPPADAQAPIDVNDARFDVLAEGRPAATPDNYPRAFLVSLDELMRDYNPGNPNSPKDYRDLDIPDEDTYVAILGERVRTERQANSKTVADLPVAKTVLTDDMFTTPAVKGMAQNASLTSVDFDGVKPSAKSGKYSVKDVKQIIASKGEQTPEPATSQPVTAPEAVTPEPVTPEPDVEAAPVNSSPIEYIMMQDGDTMLPGYREKTSGRIIVREPKEGAAISLPQEAAGPVIPLTPESLKYRSDAQRESIGKILNQLGKTEEDLVEVIAQGQIPLSKDGTIKKIDRPVLIDRLKAFDDVSDVVDEAFNARAERVLTKIDNALGGRFGELVKYKPEVARQVVLREDPQQGDRIFNELIADIDDGGVSGSNNNKDNVTGQQPLTGTEQKKVKQLAKNMIAQGIPDSLAELAATAKVVRMRGTEIQKSSGDLEGPLANPPIETTAGRTTFNKIQSFLKRGEFIGRAPSVPEGLDPDTKVIYGYDNAVNHAKRMIEEEYEVRFDVASPTEENPNAMREVIQTKTRLVPNTGVVRYVSEGGERLADGKGSLLPRADGKKNIIKPEIAKKGENYWYDPITNKAWKQEANMRMARGEGPNQTHYQSTDVPVRTDKDILDLAVENFQNDGDLSALGAALAETGKNSLVPITSEIPDVPVLSTNGKRLALRHKETGKIRVIGQNQIDEGKGLEAILGKADIEDFEVGHTKGARNSKTATEEFEPWSADRISRPYLTAQQASQQVVPLSPTKFVAELEGLKSLTDDMPMPRRQRNMVNSAINEMAENAGQVDKLTFATAIDAIETAVGWPRTGQGDLKRSYTEFFTALQTFRSSIVPEDIRKPGVTIAESQRQLKKIGRIKTEAELSELNKVLRVLSEQADDMAPAFVEGINEGDGVRVFQSTGRGSTNMDAINKVNLTRDDGNKPNLHTTLHELAHWAYTNILTPADKLEFWKVAQGYIDGASTNESKLGQSMFDLEGSPDNVRLEQRNPNHLLIGSGEDGLRYKSNMIETPQEWFANQFANWAMNERLSPEFRQDSYWNQTPFMAKMSQYVKSVVDFFINRKAIDPDLVPVFSKIIPDNLQAAALADGVLQPSSPEGKALHRIVSDLTLTHDELLEAVVSQNDERIIFLADELARKLFSISAPQQARSNRNGQSGKPFMLMGKTHKIAQTLYDRIFTALGEDVSTLSVSDAENFGFSYDAVSRNIEADAEKIIQIVYGNRVDGGDPRFETSEIIGTIISDAQKKFNQLSNENIKMTGGYAGIEFAPKSELKGYAKYSKQLRDGKRKKKRIQEQRTRETRKNADAARLNKSPTVAQIDDGQAINYRTAPHTALSDELAKYGETDYGRIVARQMKENERAAPLSDEVEPQFLDDKHTMDAIEMEVAETQGISGSSVSPGARAGINLAQQQLSQRNPDRENIARTVFYRLANLTGSERVNRRIHLAMMGISDVNEVARRIDTTDPKNATPNLAPSNYLNEEIDINSDEFGDLRNKLRSLATNLSPKSPKATGQKNAKVVVQDVIRAVVIMDPTQTMHRDIWRRTFGSLNQGGQGMEINQANWDKALDDLVKKTSANLSSKDPDLETDAFVHTVKQHVAYILNGQMDTRIKKAHPVLDAYGNVFTGESAVLRNIDEVFYPSRYDDEASGDVSGLKRITESFWNNSSQNRKDAINEFTGNTDPNNPPPVYTLTVADVGGRRPHSLGEQGLTPQTAKDERYGNGIKIRELANRSNQVHHETMIGALRESGASESEILQYTDLLEMMEIMFDSKMGLIARKNLSGEDGLGAHSEHFEASIASTEMGINVVSEQLDDILRKHKITTQEKYHPVYLGEHNPFDFTIGKDYGVDDIPAIRQIMEALDPRMATATESPISMIASRGYITGDALHQEFLEVIQEASYHSSKRSLSPAAAAQRLNKVLQDFGYDGVRGHEESVNLNNIGADTDINDIFGDTTFTMLFEDTGNIKHTMADDFDDSRHVTGYLFNKDEVTRTNVQTLNTVQEQGQLSEGQAVTMEEQLRGAGVSANAASGIGQIARGKVPNGRQQSAIRRAFNVMLGENSHNLRRMGASWIADWIAPARMEGTGHYERLAARTSNHISPIFEALNGLPGGGGVKNWIRKSTDFNLGGDGIHHRLGVDQPRSYLKIVNAIRRGPDSEATKNLTSAERLAYRRVREMFQNIHYELTESGVMVGKVKDYFPQVWNVEKILRDPDNFQAALARYFISEADRMEGEVISSAKAMERASTVYKRLVEEDGVYTPAPKGNRDAAGDHIDYQRLIRLDEFKEHLDDVGSYLENDLEAIISKYADNAVRRIDLAEKYGNESHGFYDYLNVVTANSMPDTIAKLLSTKKVSRKIIVNKMTDHIDETLEIRRESPMPFEGDEAAARRAAETLIKLADKGEPAMRQFVNSLDTARGEPAFSKRIDAIIGGILDRQNMPGPMSRKEEEFAIGSIESLQRKGTGGYGVFADDFHKTSKVLRNFNAITLLGSTVFTSFGDMVLPIVRSGSLKSYSKAMAKYMTDPHYRRMTRNIGAALENQIHERMTGLYGADSSRNTVAFFNATLLSPWTGFWRSASSAAGHEWFKAEYAIALTNFNPRLDLSKQNMKFKKAYRVLRAYGLDELLATNQRIDDFDSFIPNPSDSPQRRDAKQRVQEAVIKFSNQTIFTPNANDIPLLGQSPLGQIIYQLKSFPIMMGRLALDVGRLAVTADPVTKGGRRFSPAVMLATVAPIAGGGGANLIKDYVQARGEDETRQPRERSFNDIAESMGYDADVHGEVYGISADAFMGWYVEGMVQMGGLGLLADILYQTAEQADNGVYGQQRILSVFGGPSAGLAMDAVTFYQGVVDNDDSKNYPERAAARIAATRIPVLGGYRDIREGIVDAVAGPSGRNKTKKSSFMQNWAKPK